MVCDEQKDREEILEKVANYYDKHLSQKRAYTKGERICYASRVFDEKEICSLVDSALDFWLTSGRYCEKFETEFRKFLGVNHCYLVNSGSSANLLAFMALTSPLLKDRRIMPGDEIITVAACFPTTVSPIIQYGAIPVFIDMKIPEYNIDPENLKKAISNKTKAIFIAHTLGNPFDLEKVLNICKEYNLWLIEDNCDALGSEYLLNDKWSYTGSFGDIGTSSFYPSHHMTMGEGGAVYTNNTLLGKILLSLRDWGRDCCCPSGVDNLCSHRFDCQFGLLPQGYDHKYVYSHFGYNFKVTEMQAAIGCEQLNKMPDFIKMRVKNWKLLYTGLESLSDFLILPKATNQSRPSWFGFLITLKETKGLSREEIVPYLEDRGIQTRMLFSGNLLKHPCFTEIIRSGRGYRVVGTLNQTDIIMNNSFWVGVYPGLTDEMIYYIIDSIKSFFTDKNL